MTYRQKFIGTSIFILASIGIMYFLWPPVLWSLLLFGPIILIGFLDILQKKHAIWRNFPVIGHARWLLESIRPEIMQYFVETDTEGRPLNRIFRTLIYQRSKKVNDTAAFGTQMNVYQTGYEWMNHSMYTKATREVGQFPRITVGGKDCKQPYDMSLLNISAMSFGSLSNRAVMALNKGAKMGHFAHNTGEGGVSPYHLSSGGDLVWQVGTGYFGCRDKAGKFDPEAFQKTAKLDQIKMIELKISQGAKPGHGGILPAKKNTAEIAKIRLVEAFKDVHSPPSHSSFSSPEGLLQFIKTLRDLSGGKPVGFKLCVGEKQEFIDICKSMLSTGITPDFITVDGGEGGTGAAPVEFSNSIGMPLREGLVFVHDTLVGYGLKKDIMIIAAGKIITGFHIARVIALGADICNSARAMMLAIGCIQSLECNKNTCPVGVATQNPSLIKGLDVEDKALRVANFHEATVHSFLELIAAAGLNHSDEIKREHINRRVGSNRVMNYQELYPDVKEGSLL